MIIFLFGASYTKKIVSSRHIFKTQQKKDGCNGRLCKKVKTLEKGETLQENERRKRRRVGKRGGKEKKEREG